MSDTSDLVSQLLGLAVLLIVLIGFFGGAGGAIETDFTAKTSIDITDGSGTFAHERVKNLTANQTLGTQLTFDGSGQLEGEFNTALGGNWSVCTWARPIATNSNMTVLSLSGEQTIQYHGNRSTPQWVGSYWDAGERETYDVAVNATDTSTRTHLCFGQTNQNITLRANGTASETVTTSGTDSDQVTRYGLAAWNGSIDETRVYNRSLDSADRAALSTYPSRPLDAGASARVMYDTRENTVSSMPIYFTSNSASVSGASVTSGVGGDTLAEGTDYEVTNPALKLPRITATDGGDLEGAPVVFVTYGTKTLGLTGTFAAVWTGLTQAVEFVPVLFVGIGAVFLLSLMQRGGF